MPLELLYDFTVLNNGDPFPEGIGPGILRDDSGIFSVLSEAAPNAYFFIQKLPSQSVGTAMFNYTPDVSGGQTDYHGLICSPGVLDGRNADQSVLFQDPLQHFEDTDDSFVVEIILGFRSKGNIEEWIGGRLSSSWSSVGGWAPTTLATVLMTPNGFVLFDSKAINSPYLDLNEFLVRVKDEKIIVKYNGVDTLESGVAFQGSSQAVMRVKAYKELGGTITPVALLESYTGVSLRSGNFLPTVEEVHQHFQIPMCEAHFYQVPVLELLTEKKLKQTAPHQWEFVEDTLVVSEGHVQFKANPGTVIVE